MNTDFNYITSYLSDFSLENLVVCSSLLSALEFYCGSDQLSSYIFPAINQNNTAMFTRSIIYSESNYFKTQKISRIDLPKIINRLNDASSRTEFFQDDSLSDEDKFYFTISSLMSSQIWYQRHSIIEKTGLLYALYSEIPNKNKSDLIKRHKSNFVDIPKVIKNDVGIELELYFFISLYLINGHFRDIYDTHLSPKKGFIKNQKKEKSKKRQRQQQGLYLSTIIEKSQELYGVLGFSENWIKNRFGFIDSHKIENYLKLTSINIKELRELNSTNPFQKGHISQRITPLERYPILKTDYAVYFIPNFRFANIAFTELLRFKLQDLHKDNAFNEMLGSCQEILINNLLSEISSTFKIISERQYIKNKTHYRGPDFTIIDNGRLILIESKAKNVNLNSRLNHYSEHLLNDLNSVIHALIKAENQKLKDILYNKSIYGDIDIEDLSLNPPILVGLIGEGVVNMQEHITMLKQKFPKHPINKIKYPHIFIDLHHFSRAIEICKTNNISLYNLLFEYWQTGNNLSAKADSADMFGSKKYSYSNSYSQKMFEKLFQEGSSFIQ